MPVIKRALKQEVHWILPWNVESEANDCLSQLLGDLDCYFAKNIVSASGYVWEVADGDWKSLAEASAEDVARVRDELSAITDRIHRQIEKVYPTNESERQIFVEKFMSVPNDEYIFYCIKGDKIDIVLTGWGFKNYLRPKNGGQNKCFLNNTVPVRIGFTINGELQANHPFSVIRQTVNEQQTGDDGFFSLGTNVKPEFRLNLVSRVSEESFQLVVVEGQSDYLFEIKLPQQESQPLFEPAVVSVPEAEPEEIIEPESEPELEQEVKKPTEPKPEIPLELESEPMPQIPFDPKPEMEEDKKSIPDIIIELHDKNGNVIPNACLLLENHRGKEYEASTNGEGRIIVPATFFTHKKTVKVMPSVQGLNVKSCKIKYDSMCDFYIVKLKDYRRLGCLWWFLLLFPLLLFVRCERDITVTCIDEKTKVPIKDVEVAFDYTAHFLYKDGAFFVNEPHFYKQTTDTLGCTVFRNLECSVYSYIFHCLSKVNVVADETVSLERLFHFTRQILLELENIDCEVDIVMCIDNTSSMGNLLNTVKENALNFHSDLKMYAEKKRRNIKKIRLKVIAFGDLVEKPIDESSMFIIPEETDKYQTFINTIRCEGGGDNPENGLEALAIAINTDWVKSNYRFRHVILLYTDAPAHALEDLVTHTGFYPPNMPRNLTELTKLWNHMDTQARRLVLFAPSVYPWNEIAASWGDVSHKFENLNIVLSSDGYKGILEEICKSL